VSSNVKWFYGRKNETQKIDIKMNNTIQNIVEDLTPEASQSLYLLSFPFYLNDDVAMNLLVRSGLANGNASDLINEIRSFPIWHEETRRSWVIDDDVREYIFSKLNGSAETIRLTVLNAMQEIRLKPEELSQSGNLRQFDLQLARLSLTVEHEQEKGINALRKFFNENNDETLRVIDLYIDENLSSTISHIKILPDHLQNAYFMRGSYAYKINDFKSAMHFLKPVWKRRSGTYQSVQDAAVAAHLIGLIFCKEYRYKKAEDAYRESLELSKQVNNLIGQAHVSHSLGNLLRLNNRHIEAKEALERSISILEDRGNQSDVAIVLNSLGGVLRHLGDLEGAKEALERSISILEDRGNQSDVAIVLNSLGGVLRHLGDLEGAKEALERSISIHEDRGDQANVAIVLNSLGGVLRHLGDLEGAKEALERSISIHEGRGDQANVAIVLNSLGGVLRDLGDLEGAKEALERSISIHEDRGDQSSVAITKKNIQNIEKWITKIKKASNEQTRKSVFANFHLESATNLFYSNDFFGSLIHSKQALSHTSNQNTKIKCYEKIAFSAYRLRMLDLAAEYFEIVLSHERDSASIRATYANTLSEIGEPLDNYEYHFKKALELDENHVWALSWYGLSLAREKKRFSEAVELARLSVKLRPNHSALLYNLATILMTSTEIKDILEAESILKQAISVAPPGFHLAKIALEKLSKTNL